MMRGVWAMCQKEWKANFATFFHFIPLIFFSFISGFLFFTQVSQLSHLSGSVKMAGEELSFYVTQALVHPFFMNIGVLLVLVIPTFVMRVFSEERKTGTFELLFTYPLSDGEIVLGKWLALVGYLTLLLLPTAVFFALLGFFHYAVEPAALAVAYLGLMLIGTTLISAGMLISSLTENQLAGAAMGLLLFGAMWLSGWASELAIPNLPVWTKEWWIIEQLREFSRGILDTRSVIFEILASGFFFFATFLSLASRSWKR